VLACTEIGLLIGPDDAEVPIFDTTRLHAHAPSISHSRRDSAVKDRGQAPARP